MSLNYTALSWTQLRKLAKDRGVKVSTKNSIIAQLKEQDTAVAKAKLEERIKAHQDTPTAKTTKRQSHVVDGVDVVNFDVRKYAGFVLQPHLATLGCTGRQWALAKALECHYKVTIELKPQLTIEQRKELSDLDIREGTRGHLSYRLGKCIDAILAGTITEREPEQVIARINKFFPKSRNQMEFEAMVDEM